MHLEGDRPGGGATGRARHPDLHQRRRQATGLPEFAPIFEDAARRNLAIWMHPARGAEFPDYMTEDEIEV